MKLVSTALAAHLNSNATTLADCLYLKRADNTVFTFTAHQVDLVISGLTYISAPGIFSAAIASKDSMQADNTELKGIFDAVGVTLDSIRAGDWDHARFRLFRVNWASLAMGSLNLMKGRMGLLTTHSHLIAELRGLAAALQATIGKLVVPACMWALGDTNCGVDLYNTSHFYHVTGAVMVTVSGRQFDTNLATSSVNLTPLTIGTPPLSYFVGAVLLWLTGANVGRREVVKVYELDGTVELQLPMYSTIAVGDTFTVHAGCDHTRLGDCLVKFDNVIHFGGFDLLPGQDVTMKTGGQV